MARAVFTLREKDGGLCGMLTLHVDDGMIFGNIKSKTYSAARQAMDKKFSIKGWKKLNDKVDVEYLGVSWRQTSEYIVMHMDGYIQGLQPMQVPKGEDTVQLGEHDFSPISQPTVQSTLACEPRGT